MGFSVDRLSYRPLLYILENLREGNHKEVYARSGYDPMGVASKLLPFDDTGWIGYYEGVPAVAGGVIEVAPKIWQFYMFGTDGIEKCQKSVIKFARKVIFPLLESEDYYMAYALIMDWHKASPVWLNFLGFQYKRDVLEWGLNGETFQLWIKEMR